MAEAQACEDSGRRRPRPAPSSTRLSPKRPSSAPFLPPASARAVPSICRAARDRSGEEATTARPRSPSRSRPASESLFVTSETPPRRLRYPPTPSPLAEKSFAGRGLDVCDLNEEATAAPYRDDIMDPEEGCARAPHPARAAGAQGRRRLVTPMSIRSVDSIFSSRFAAALSFTFFLAIAGTLR